MGVYCLKTIFAEIIAMKIKQTFIVPELNRAIRFVDYACEIITIIPSRSGIKKAIKRGELLLDGIKVEEGRWIKEGMEIQLGEIERKPLKIFPLALEVVFEDEYIAVINKPAGYEVSGNKYQTIYNALPRNLRISSEPDALLNPLPIHRLDYPTSGLLLIAKTRKARIELGKQLEEKKIKKRYRAIVQGKLEGNGELNEPIDEKESVSEYSCVKIVPSLQSEFLTLVDLWPHTGRTHQLRIHMAGIDHPIVGDKKYGNPDSMLKHKGLFLAAVELTFVHPVSGEILNVEINEPNKYKALLIRESQRWSKFRELKD